uniref:PhaC_N domain-containing protein n=1 Tax=Ascaris lumbricoides TaxID=6252 RepID=A0A0M3IHL9_ASCLU
MGQVKPSALLSVLNKADLGFNQAINHFEQGTPLESAAIDILEVALGSQKLDSQAKLLGHVDRTIGIDNLQRLQRWANTGGALDAIKEQFAKIAKNYSPPENLLPTIPPQFNYLFTPTGKR